MGHRGRENPDTICAQISSAFQSIRFFMKRVRYLHILSATKKAEFAFGTNKVGGKRKE